MRRASSPKQRRRFAAPPISKLRLSLGACREIRHYASRAHISAFGIYASRRRLSLSAAPCAKCLSTYRFYRTPSRLHRELKLLLSQPASNAALFRHRPNRAYKALVSFDIYIIIHLIEYIAHRPRLPLSLTTRSSRRRRHIRLPRYRDV